MAYLLGQLVNNVATALKLPDWATSLVIVLLAVGSPVAALRSVDIRTLSRGVAVLHGWRAEVFGHDAVALRDGKLALSLERGEAVVIETGVERKPRAAKAR